MLKIFLLFVAFAAYGIHSLIEQLPGSAQEPTQAATSTTEKATSGLTYIAGKWVGQAATQVGLQVERIPEPPNQCESASVDTERLEDVISSLPEQQQNFFKALLEKTPSNALPQWYQGENGTGL